HDRQASGWSAAGAHDRSGAARDPQMSASAAMMRVRSGRGWGLLGVLIVLLATLAGCPGASDAPVRLRVLASSELVDLQPLLAELRAKTGVELDVEYRGTVDASDAIVDGNKDRFDLAWLSSDRYLELRRRKLQPGSPTPLSTTIMTSPVVVGVT